MLSKETLKQSVEDALKTVRLRQRDVTAAQGLLAEAERELELLTELAQIRQVELPEDVHAAKVEAPTARGEPMRGGRSPSRSKSALLGAVVEILEAHGEPMQIQDLMAAVRERPVKIPGQGVQANLIAYISRDPRIVRPRRGFYGLAKWGLEDTTPAPKPKRRRRRRPGSAR